MYPFGRLLSDSWSKGRRLTLEAERPFRGINNGCIFKSMRVVAD